MFWYYLKKVIKVVLILALPVYLVYELYPREIKNEVTLYVTTNLNKGFRVFVVTQSDSTKEYFVQKQLYLEKDKEEEVVIEGASITDTLYLIAENSGVKTFHEYIISTESYNELPITEDNEVVFLTDDLKNAVSAYNTENSKNIFLVILCIWLIFVLIYIRSRK